MKTLEELSGYDKAAIVFDILGESLAINMFKDIPESEFYKLRDHAKSIRNNVSTTVKKEVLEDYYFKMLTNEKYKDQPSSEEMFDFLNNLDDEQLYSLLSPEKPRVIALALEQIDIDKKMTFISKIEPEKQNKIVLQTGDLKDIPLEAVIFTAKDLKKKAAFLPEPVKFSRGGGKSVSDMLSKMSEDDAKKYLEQMKLDSPDLLNEVKQYYLLFDDVIAMPDNIAATFWGSPDIEDLDMMAMALAELDSETVQKLGFVIGLHTKKINKNEIDFIVKTLLSIDNL